VEGFEKVNCNIQGEGKNVQGKWIFYVVKMDQAILH